MKGSSYRVKFPIHSGSAPSAIAPDSAAGGRVVLLLDRLTSAGIDYALLGSARRDPDAPRNDVDLLVRRSDAAAVMNLSRSFAVETSGGLARIVPTKDGWFCVLAWLQTSGEVAVVRLDLHTRLPIPVRGRRSLEAVLDSRVRLSNGTFAVSAGVQFVQALVKAAARGDLKPETRIELADLHREDPEGVRSEIQRTWPGRDYGDVAAGGSDLSRLAREAVPWSRRIRTRVGGILARIRRAFVRDSLTVAILGIDGSGKSSMTRRMARLLDPVYPERRFFHFKPNLFGRPHRPVCEGAWHPAGVESGVSWLGLVRLVYYLVDYSLGYLCKIRPQRAKSRLLIFDRHFYDLWIDPIRLRSRIPMALARRAAVLVPKPDLILVVDADAAEARKRKPLGPPIEEATRQRAGYLELADRFTPAFVLDGSLDVRDVAREAAGKILDRLHIRATRGE